MVCEHQHLRFFRFLLHYHWIFGGTYISAGGAVLPATAAKLSCEDACTFQRALGSLSRASSA